MAQRSALVLDHVGITHAEPEVLGELLRKVFGVPGEPVADRGLSGGAAWVAQLGGVRLEIRTGRGPGPGGRPSPLDHVAFRVGGEPAEVASRWWTAGREGAGSAPAFPDLVGRPSAWLPWPDTAGVPIELVAGTPGATGGASAPQGTPGLDHVGIACADVGRARGLFVDRLGLEYESLQTDVEYHLAVESFTSDRYGVVSHVRPPRLIRGLRVLFVRAVTGDLEFLQDIGAEGGVGGANEGAPPESPAATPGHGTTAGDRGAIAGYVARYGEGLHHLALRVDDADRALRAAVDAGAQPIDSVPRPGSRRSRIAFFRPRSTGGLLLHIVQREDGP